MYKEYAVLSEELNLSKPVISEIRDKWNHVSEDSLYLITSPHLIVEKMKKYRSKGL